MTGVSIHAEGLNEAQRALGRIARGEDRAAMMEEIGAYGEASTLERFEEQRGPDGTPWNPSQRAREQAGQTLVDQGHLRNSLTHLSSADSAEWGSNRIYAGIHQEGGVIRAKGGGKLRFSLADGGFAVVDQVTMPARPYLGISGEDRVEIGLIAVDHLRRQLRPRR